MEFNRQGSHECPDSERKQGQLLSEKLFYSGEKGDVNRCWELIRNGADVNWRAGSDLVS